MQKRHAALLLVAPFLFPAADAADALLPSMPAISVAQAEAGNVRLVVWELPNGNGIQAQALDATTHEVLSDRITLGEELITNEADLLAGGVQTRPAVAGLAGAGGEAVFLVAWHAEIAVDGNSAGTEIIGRRLVVDSNGNVQLDAPLRISRVDDDTNVTAVSESLSSPVVAANAVEDEFLVLWTHWPHARTSNDGLVSNDEYSIYGQEIDTDRTLKGNAAIRIDAQTAPVDDNGLPARGGLNPIFIAAVPRVNESGYLLAWSDPSQEGGNVQQLFTKLLPANLATVDINARNAIGDSTSITKGTGRIAVASLPQEEGFLLAYEDTRGMAPLDGFVLDADGKRLSEAFHLLANGMQLGDSVFLLPQLVSLPGEGKLLLYAAVGNLSLAGSAPQELSLLTGRLVRRTLDPLALAFSQSGSDFETIPDRAYPEVNIYFAAQAHDAGALPGDDGAVSFVVNPDASQIAIDAFTFDTESPPPPPPPPPPQPAPPSGNEGGGGAVFLLLFLLPWFRAARLKRAAVIGALLLSSTTQASPPDVELLHSGDGKRACYRAVMYREVNAIHLGVTWGGAAFPADMAIEIEKLPSGWRAEKVTEQNGKAQVVLLRPAPFDTTTGFSIGKVCLGFTRDVPGLDRIPYTYELAATGSRINAKARPDDGVSEDELRAMVKRGERLKNSADPLAKPKQVEEAAKTVKRLKGLFD